MTITERVQECRLIENIRLEYLWQQAVELVESNDPKTAIAGINAGVHILARQAVLNGLNTPVTVHAATTVDYNALRHRLDALTAQDS